MVTDNKTVETFGEFELLFGAAKPSKRLRLAETGSQDGVLLPEPSNLLFRTVRKSLKHTVNTSCNISLLSSRKHILPYPILIALSGNTSDLSGIANSITSVNSNTLRSTSFIHVALAQMALLLGNPKSTSLSGWLRQQLMSRSHVISYY